MKLRIMFSLEVFSAHQQFMAEKTVPKRLLNVYSDLLVPAALTAAARRSHNSNRDNRRRTKCPR
jgi:hypothetical protein